MRGGYGTIKDQGRQTSPHRVVLEDKLGRPLKEMALHTCDNRVCCNPRHLYEGSHGQNMQDRSARGRSARNAGERNGQAKLTPEQVKAIRDGGDAKALAAEFGVGVSHIHRIRRGERW